MKVKIEHPKQIQAQEVEQTDIFKFTLENIQQVEDSICTSLYIGNVLDYHTNRDEVLLMLIKKVRYDGTIIIYGADIIAVTYALTMGHINEQQASVLFYDEKKSCTSIEYMKNLLINTGMNITKADIFNHQYCITAQRPNPRYATSQ